MTFTRQGCGCAIAVLVLLPGGRATASFRSPEFADYSNQQPQDRSIAVDFFDVPELPARIVEPKLRRADQGFVLDCAVANRSGEALLGIRLIMLVVDASGKFRRRITWTERSELASYSIKLFEFHPAVPASLRSNDQLVLGIDEVIGRETIWRAAGAEKALRAYSRGQHDVLPTVRTLANKFDPRSDARKIY